MKSQLRHKFSDIVSLDNLLFAWQEFLPGKRNKKDVQEFSRNLIDNILQLHQELANKTYKHSGYIAFNISDPKPRNIHKATVRDRLLHHAIYRILYPFFSRTFIADSFSCQKGKGTHRAIKRFQTLALKASKNNTKTIWVLKCDIKKFFASISQKVLVEVIEQYIADKDVIWLLKEVINSFETKPNTGLPLGNLTSQLFVNIYMNEFDQFIKHKLKTRFYIRYADDFVVLSEKKERLLFLIPKIKKFLENKLYLELHPDKIFIKTWASGVDFLGWVNFPTHRVLRTATQRRVFKRMKDSPKNETLQSYLGLLKHGDTTKLSEKLQNIYWLMYK